MKALPFLAGLAIGYVLAVILRQHSTPDPRTRNFPEDWTGWETDAA